MGSWADYIIIYRAGGKQYMVTADTYAEAFNKWQDLICGIGADAEVYYRGIDPEDPDSPASYREIFS